jgi:hypothetical protein
MDHNLMDVGVQAFAVQHPLCHMGIDPLIRWIPEAVIKIQVDNDRYKHGKYQADLPAGFFLYA